MLASMGMIDLDPPTVVNQFRADENTGSTRSDVYRPHLADLVAKRPSRPLTVLVFWMARVLRPGVTLPGVCVGLVALLLSAIASLTTISISQVVQFWIDSPVLAISIIPLAFFVRLLVHEAGHYAVALDVGVRPKVGAGVYITGPVLYVDLSALDPLPLRTRLRADAAGLALDGLLLAGITATALLCDLSVTAATAVAAVQLELTLAVLASLNPIEKSDLNWALRDMMGARHVTTSWPEFGALLRTARDRTDAPASRFASLLLGVLVLYLVLGVWVGAGWLTDIRSSPPRVSVGELGPLVALLSAIVAGIAIRRARKKTE